MVQPLPTGVKMIFGEAPVLQISRIAPMWPIAPTGFAPLQRKKKLKKNIKRGGTRFKRKRMKKNPRRHDTKIPGILCQQKTRFVL